MSTSSRPPTMSPHRVRQISLLLHLGRTSRLIGAVLNDARVHWLPKLVFLGSLTFLLVALFVPEAVADVLGLVAPVFDLFGIPVEAGVDWVIIAVAAFNLLKLFPKEVVGEHYDRLFRK